MASVQFELNGAKLRVYETGKIEIFKKKRSDSREETWFQLFGSTKTNKDGYKFHRTEINKKQYITSRIIYNAFNQNWDINDNSKYNTIDHISRNSLDNNLCNLRVATSKEQRINQDRFINAKGYRFRNGKYEAQIGVNGKTIQLGKYPTAEEAHDAYLVAVEKYRNKIL